jgi:hypothetical protein
VSRPVYFTQFLFPDGRLRSDHIDMPDDVAALAEELRKAGWSFEIECFPDTQVVHADCCDDEAPIASAMRPNGPEVPEMIEQLIRSAHERWVQLGRPKAQGDRLARHERLIGLEAS